jgi:hypothetical protein
VPVFEFCFDERVNIREQYPEASSIHAMTRQKSLSQEGPNF